MAARTSLAAPPRWILTAEGHAAAWSEDRCHCQIERIENQLVCSKCGTAWGMNRGASMIVGPKNG